MSEEIKPGMRCAIDKLETERRVLWASQEIDTQIVQMRPWLEYRKAVADKWLHIPPHRSEGRNDLEELFNHINKEIAKLMGL